MCSFEIDRARGLLRTTLSGFFEIDDVVRYQLGRNDALRRLGCLPNRHVTLVDVSGCQLSTPDVVAALQKVIGEPGFRSWRCAMVVPGALARMQARRAVQGRGEVEMFDCRENAERWLLETEQVAA